MSVAVTKIKEDKRHLNYSVGWRESWEQFSDALTFLLVLRTGGCSLAGRREIALEIRKNLEVVKH